MTLLQDTHAFLFLIGEPERLTASMRKALTNSKNDRWVSVVSLWEMVKVQIGKLALPLDPAFYQQHIRRLHANVLTVEARHSFELMRLPMIHRDPFDRLLIAQARADGLTFVTQDVIAAKYPVSIAW
jgi:PIN domain nuclease of toxin-antitoxin system